MNDLFLFITAKHHLKYNQKIHINMLLRISLCFVTTVKYLTCWVTDA